MSKNLTIGNKTFLYPTPGTNPEEGWGDEATGWAEEVTTVLGTIQGPNDITLTSVSLVNNVTTPTNITGLKFSTVAVISIKVEYLIKRVLGAQVLTEFGQVFGTFDGVNFKISQTAEGDTGVSLDITNSGQFVYVSTDEPSQISCIMKFKATTIAN